ncbi:MAG: hypothetical protein H0V82_05480 [Candidatus Protochlamydia sp.]|nr:hypothetical protein [Candidatus Protochlamydia sp.]
MDELFVENFSKRRSPERAITRDLDQIFFKETIQDPIITLDLQNKSALMLDIGIFLSRLENEIERQYADFADYRFFFNRIRTAFKQNSVEGVFEQLDSLEELLDLALPSLLIKKNLV